MRHAPSDPKSNRAHRFSRHHILLGVAGWAALASLTHIARLDILSTVLSFSFAITVPGVLCVIACNIPRKLPPAALSTLATGFSILCLLATGLTLNTILPYLGVARPLDTPFVWGGVGVLVGVLMCLAWRRLGRYSVTLKPNLLARKRPLSWAYVAHYVIPLLVVALSILGAIRLNNHGGGTVAALHLALTVAYVAWLMHRSERIPQGTITFALTCLALSLLLMTSLRGWLTTGHDVQREMYVFTLAKQAGVWHMEAYKDAYNACLSITILPTIFSRLTQVSDPYIYKVFYQLIFALVPGMVYGIARKYLRPSLAIASAVWFMAFPTFFGDMPMLNRQEIGFLFLSLMIWLAFESRLETSLRRRLFVVFGMGLVVSHYSTTYSVIAIFGFTIIARHILRRRYNNRPRRTKSPQYAGTDLVRPVRIKGLEYTFISSRLLLVLAVASFIWTSLITSTGSGVAHLITQTATTVLRGGGEDTRSGDVSYSLFSRRKLSSQERLAAYRMNEVTAIRAADPAAFFSDEDVSTAVVQATDDTDTPLRTPGKLLGNLGIPAHSANDTFRQLSAKLLQVLILVGAGYVMYKRTFLAARPDGEFLALALGSLAFVIAQLFLPVLSAEYGLLRAFQQALMVLGLFMVIGLSVILPKRLNRFKIGLSETAATIFLLSSTGLISWIIGGYTPQLHLSNSGTYYDTYYTQRSEELMGIWLASLKTGTAAPLVVQADRYTFFRLNTKGEFEQGEDIIPGLVRRDGLVALGEAATLRRTAMFERNGDVVTYAYPIDFLGAHKNRVYSNGKATVYY